MMQCHRGRALFSFYVKYIYLRVKPIWRSSWRRQQEHTCETRVVIFVEVDWLAWTINERFTLGFHDSRARNHQFQVRHSLCWKRPTVLFQSCSYESSVLRNRRENGCWAVWLALWSSASVNLIVKDVHVQHIERSWRNLLAAFVQ